MAFGKPKTNVLLVLLEGVSGAYIEPIVAANDRRPIGISMPELSRIARDHVVFTSFIAQQRQTNRGEYAAICRGSFPQRPRSQNWRRALTCALSSAAFPQRSQRPATQPSTCRRRR